MVILNFFLSILEYCEPEKCLEREDYYFKLLKPEYNTSLNPSATMSGRKHSEETKTKISEALIGENNPMYGKPKSEGAGIPSQAIEVTNIKNNITTTYISMGEASRALNIPFTRRAAISIYFIRNQQKP